MHSCFLHVFCGLQFLKWLTRLYWLYDMLIRLNNKYIDQIIKNTYRTLMTRGMKGCYVYCTNKELADYLRERIK